jgi:Mn2+/Fe2+ NRAMP family transporter
LGFLLPFIGNYTGGIILGFDPLQYYRNECWICSVALVELFNFIPIGIAILLLLKLKYQWGVRISVLFVFSFIFLMHLQLDLSLDAQAAVALVFIPVFSTPFFLFSLLPYLCVRSSDTFKKS